MTDPIYDRTIDWSLHWEQADVETKADVSPSAEFIVDPLLEFLEAMGEEPDTYADIGCGAGAVVFAIAERYPETTVVGFDSALPVLETNRERARSADRRNLQFEAARLPAFDPVGQFDVVSSFFTLCYVADVERALGNLYDAVAPGGYLVFTYHNKFAQSMFTDIAESPEDYLDETSSWDPERFPERFELVLEGESLLSYEQIHDVLGTWPQSVWSGVEETNRYGAWRQNPLVYVPK